MADVNAFASLSAGLLARKGEARPAMRPQLAAERPAEDLGWNDMGEGAPASARPLVLRQQDEIAREFAFAARCIAGAGEAAAPPPRADRAAGRRIAFTLRLDGERHLRLRLAAAAGHRSAQQIVTQALDEFLARTPDAERLAATLAGGA